MAPPLARRGLGPGALSGMAAPADDPPLNLHATTVAWAGAAVLILGASGSGKSALGLALMAWGCALVADDRTLIRRQGASLIASSPARLMGRIEARGVGLLPAAALPCARLVLAVDLDQTETARLPHPRRAAFLGLELPLLHKPESSLFAAAILQYLKVLKDRA